MSLPIVMQIGQGILMIEDQPLEWLCSNPISWSSKKQNTVSRSSIEVEYRALSTTAAEIDWIKQLLVFLHVPFSDKPLLFFDNLLAIALTCNPI